MENIYENITTMTKHKIMPEQTIIENNITIENSENISKVLSVSSNVNLDMPIEAMNNECSLSGKILTNVVYTTNDGEINNQISTSPFVYKLLNSNLDANCKVNVQASVENTEINKVANGQIKILTTIGIDGVIIKNNEVSYLKETEENTYVKQQEQKIVALKSQNCEKFEEKLEFNVKNGAKKVLITDVDCILKEWTSGYNFISVELELYAKVLYIDKNDPAELQTITLSKIVKQEIEAEGVDKDSDLDVFATIIKENIETVIDELENGETNIIVSFPMLVCYNSYSCNLILSVVDVYSTNNVLAIENGEIENGNNCKPEYLESKIEGNVVLDDNEPRIDKYLSTTNINASISNYYVKEGSLYIEGIVTANIIYLNDELGSIQSVQIEIPYVLDKNVDLTENDILEPKICIVDADVMVKRGREIYLDAKAKAFVNVTCKTKCNFITNIENVSEIPVRNNAIEIYFARAGETFWDIGKNLKIPAEMIRNQNPDLVDPLDKDQNIALYFQKGKNN